MPCSTLTIRLSLGPKISDGPSPPRGQEVDPEAAKLQSMCASATTAGHAGAQLLAIPTHFDAWQCRSCHKQELAVGPPPLFQLVSHFPPMLTRMFPPHHRGKTDIKERQQATEEGEKDTQMAEQEDEGNIPLYSNPEAWADNRYVRSPPPHLLLSCSSSFWKGRFLAPGRRIVPRFKFGLTEILPAIIVL